MARLGENVEKVWWEQMGLVQAGTREKVDLLHCPYFAAPLVRPCPTVVTIHDVIPLVLPEYAWRKASRIYTALVSSTSKRADAIITVSECSKPRHRARRSASRPSAIHVIGNAVAPELLPDPRLLAAGRGPRALQHRPQVHPLLRRLRPAQERPADHPRPTRALPPSCAAEYQLVIAGRLHHLGHPLYPDPRPLVRELDLGDRMIFTGQIREQDKAPLYSGATVFVFPSLYEGFGMPVLEAMACGAPVVTSRVSALPEVVGRRRRAGRPVQRAGDLPRRSASS